MRPSPRDTLRHKREAWSLLGQNRQLFKIQKVGELLWALVGDVMLRYQKVKYDSSNHHSKDFKIIPVIFVSGSEKIRCS